MADVLADGESLAIDTDMIDAPLPVTDTPKKSKDKKEKKDKKDKKRKHSDVNGNAEPEVADGEKKKKKKRKSEVAEE
jgi:nucleolar protein 56